MVDVGWRWIFFAAAAVSIIGLILIKGTPESKAERKQQYKRDYAGILTFMMAMIALQLFIAKGSQLGFTSVAGIVLMATILLFTILFFHIEKGKQGAFIDFKLFHNQIFTGATISNFLLNGTAGILIVSLMLLQVGGNLSAQEAGMLTLGYAIAIILFIRTGEKLLQQFGARKPMIWGSLIVGLAILLLMFTNVMTGTYKILAMIAYTLFGLGLAFYATPSTDAALSNLPADQAGAGSGIYKMASSLGAALGVAISAGIFAAFNTGGHVLWMEGVLTFEGRQDNVVVRQAAIIALGANLLMILLAILFIMMTIPKSAGKTDA